MIKSEFCNNCYQFGYTVEFARLIENLVYIHWKCGICGTEMVTYQNMNEK